MKIKRAKSSAKNPLKTRKPWVAVDTETTGLRVWKGDRPFAVSLEYEDGRSAYYEWIVDPTTRQPIVPQEDVAALNAALGDDTIEKCFWNLKFDVNMLAAIGVNVAWPMHEGTFMAKACDNLQYDYRLKRVAKRYLQIGDEDQKDLKSAVVRARRVAKKLGWAIAEEVEADYWLPRTLKALKPLAYAKAGLGDAWKACEKYCRMDTARTLQLCQLFEYGMNDLGVRPVYDFEMELMREVTIGMERRGVRVDPDRLAKVGKICKATADKALAAVREAAGRDDFNIHKAADVVSLLFDGEGPGGLKLPSLSRNKNGDPKVDAEALMPHKHDHKVVDEIMRFRSNDKALNTFFKPYEYASRKERHGLILHTNWHQWGTLTGRFSSTDPSFQCVSNPKTTNSKSAEYVVDVRQVFVPRRNHVWYCPDYSQVEVILFADIAQEPTMLEAIRTGGDIHMAVTNKIWGGEDNPRAIEAMKKSIMAAEAQKRREGQDYEDFDETSRELRSLAEQLLQKHDWKIADAESSIGVKLHRKLSKSATFTKIFGGGWRALMGWIGVSPEEAKLLIRWYDESFPVMVERMREIEKRGKADRFIVNPFGRRLTIDPWYAYRAVNYVVQSSAADLMKRGMLKCVRYLKSIGMERLIQLIMTIHDELVFEFENGSDHPKVVKRLCNLMSDHGGVFSVDTPVDLEKVTERWSMKEKVSIA